MFPAVEADHFEVHSIGDNHADVTEGTGTGIGSNWERCRYDWSTPGLLTARVTDSNVYAPGSSWTITATAAARGSRVEMTWARQSKHTIRGRLFGTTFQPGQAAPRDVHQGERFDQDDPRIGALGVQ